MANKTMRYVGAFLCVMSGLLINGGRCEGATSFLCRKYLEDSFCVSTGKALGAEEIFDLARLALGKKNASVKDKGKAPMDDALAALSLVEQEWGATISYTIKKINRSSGKMPVPIKVILGGGVIDYNQDILKTILAKNSIPRGIEFVFSTLGDSRAILGAVTHAKSNYESSVSAKHRYAIGIDLGGTHIRVALVDMMDMQVVGGIVKQKLFQCIEDTTLMASFSERMLKNKKIESFFGAEQVCHEQLANVVLTNIAHLVKKTAEGKDIAFVAMSSAGEFTDDGYCTRAVFLPFSHVHVRKELEARIKLPVMVARDVYCGALGEMAFGAGRDVGQFVFVVLGTFAGVQLFDCETWDCRCVF